MSPIITSGPPHYIPTAPRRSRLGIGLFPGANEQMKYMLNSKSSLVDLAERFAFPFLRRGDPLVWWYMASPMDRVPTYADLINPDAEISKQACEVNQAARAAGVELISYINRPETPEEIQHARSAFPLPVWMDGWSVCVDASIGRGADLVIIRRGRRNYVEPRADNAADARFPYIIATDHLIRVLGDPREVLPSQGEPNYWLPIPTDGSGPEGVMWYHEANPTKTDMLRWWEWCTARHLSLVIPGDLFDVGMVKRADFGR